MARDGGQQVGIELRGDARDIAVLWTLSDGAPDLVSLPWTEHLCADGSVVLSCPAIDPDVASQLQARGVTFSAVPEGAVRQAAHLAEAVRPHRRPGDPPCERAWFLVDRTSRAATDTLERLLRLGRDDARVAVLSGDDAETLLVEVDKPPVYLLMRAREQPQEGVDAYSQQGNRPLMVAWGYGHPLFEIASRLALRTQTTVLIDASGRWRTLPHALVMRSIYDAITPSLGHPNEPPPTLDLRPAAGEVRFPLQVHLAPGPELPPELWLLDQAGFARLEGLVCSASPDELSRITVSRLSEPTGAVRYLLRERSHTSVAGAARSRMGPHIVQFTGSAGYVRVAGTDNLYLPVRERLQPALRRDDLKTLFGLDTAKVVLVEHTLDGLKPGPRVVRIAELTEGPLSSFVDLLSFDRRVELDRLMEAALLQPPRIEIEPAPARERPAEVPPPPKQAEPRPPKARPTPQAAPKPAVSEEVSTLPNAEIRAQAAVYEAQIAAGGVSTPDVFRALGHLEEALGETHDACTCLEAALFHGDAEPAELAALAALRTRLADPSLRKLDLDALALHEPLSSPAASLLGARVLQQMGAGLGRLEDGLLQHVVQLFSSPELPVSRRLAWAVLRACHASSADTLGLVRAKEALLGGINASGLAPGVDVPRFVRSVLALGEFGREKAARHTDQLHLLEEICESDLVSSSRAKDVLDTTAALRLVILATGLLRLGATARARVLIERVSVATRGKYTLLMAPAVGLIWLYTARMGIAAEETEQWKAEVQRVRERLMSDRAWKAIEWFCKRSVWLATEQSAETTPWVRRPVQEAMAEMEIDPRRAPTVIDSLLRDRTHYDYEIAAAVEQGVNVVMSTGVDALMSAIVQTVIGRVDHIAAKTPRARVLGACVRAAAAASARWTVDSLLDKIVALTQGQDAPSQGALLLAVRPALAALRPLGAADSALAFLAALVPGRETMDQVPLLAALAVGCRHAGDIPQAALLLDRALLLTVSPQSSDYGERDLAGAALLSALRHWPVESRSGPLSSLYRSVGLFRDAFSVNAHFPTLQLLLLERLVDTTADGEVLAADRVRIWLDEEELSIRRQIHADCGALSSP